MERPHRELRAGLTDRLCGDDADRIANLHQRPRPQVPAIAFLAQSVARLAGERRTEIDLVDLRHGGDGIAHVLVDLVVALHEDLARHRVDDGCRRNPAHQLIHALRALVLIRKLLDPDAVLGPAVFVIDNQALRNVDEPSRQIARVGCLDSRVGKTLASSVRGEEVLEH